MKNIIKITLIVLILLLFCVVIFYLADKKDSCLDTGICSEGVEVNTQYGKMKVNEENCLKYNWKWDNNKKWCDFNSQKN